MLLGNTAATGASLEIMPMLNGEDGFNDPLYFNASGNYGISFSYDEFSTPSYLGNTAQLKGFDTYKIGLFVDYAITGLALEDATVATSPGDYDSDGDVDGADFLRWQREFGHVVEPQGSGADGDGSGQVDAGDLMVWQQHYGGTAPLIASSHVVPEPRSSILIVALCLVDGIVLQRNKLVGYAWPLPARK